MWNVDAVDGRRWSQRVATRQSTVTLIKSTKRPFDHRSTVEVRLLSCYAVYWMIKGRGAGAPVQYHGGKSIPGYHGVGTLCDRPRPRPVP